MLISDSVKFKSIIICSFVLRVYCNDYCSLKSCPNEHTMCKYPNKVGCPPPADKVQVGLTNEERELLLDRHNQLRSNIATGKTKFPKASNMMKLRWDKEVEHIAQRWALQCKFGHDTCRDTLKGEAAGQNIAMQSPKKSSADGRKVSLTDAVNSFYSENENMDPADIRSFKNVGKSGQAIGHFTQLVWAKSNRLGCGYIQFPQNEGFDTMHLICNYVDAGNYMDAQVYEQGEPCKSCPADTRCSKTYPGLCTEKEFDHKEVPPLDEHDRKTGHGGSDSMQSEAVLLILVLIHVLYEMLL